MCTSWPPAWRFSKQYQRQFVEGRPATERKTTTRPAVVQPTVFIRAFAAARADSSAKPATVYTKQQSADLYLNASLTTLLYLFSVFDCNVPSRLTAVYSHLHRVLLFWSGFEWLCCWFDFGGEVGFKQRGAQTSGVRSELSPEGWAGPRVLIWGVGGFCEGEKTGEAGG